MFESAVLRLLEGAFICESTWPAVFRWLRAPENAKDVSDHLARIGRTLTETPNRQAFFATWHKIGPNERIEAKRVMTTIKQTIVPVVQFVTLCMDAQNRQDVSPVPGDRLDYPTLLVAITNKPHLQERLREFASFGKEFGVNDATPKAMLEKLIQILEKYGYLAILNKDQSVWVWTGKLDYLFMVVEFLLENEAQISAEDSTEMESAPGATGRLL